MPHFFASNLRAVVLPARTKNFEFIFEAKSVRDESAIIFVKSLAKSLHGGQKILLSKQKKGARFLVKFNKHFSTHSKEIIKSALKEYAELVGAEIVAHNLSENKIKVDSVYMLDWRGICALLAGNSSLDLHSADFANLGHCADFSLALRPKFAKNHESQTENPSVVDSANLSLINSQNLGENQTKITESTLDSANQLQQTIEGIAVEVVGFLGDFGCETGLKSAKHSKSPKSPQDAPKSKLSTRDEIAMLEIGFGSGRHILHLAQKHPTAKIIGLEIYRPAISQVLRQIEILGLQNLYVASIDARVLCEVLPAKCLDMIYLHFPVPWDKNPQRRVLSAQFLDNAMRALKDDGFFELLTDSAEYFTFAKSLAGDYEFKAEEGAEGEVRSKYEARWRRQKKVIYKLCIYPAYGNSSLGLHSADFANLGHCTDFSLALRPKFAKNHESQTENPSVVDSTNLINSQNLGEKCAKIAESTPNPTPFTPTKICKKEYFLHIKNKYIFEGGVVLFASFGAYYAPSSAYFVICGDKISTISEIIPTRANIDALGLFMELCFDN